MTSPIAERNFRDSRHPLLWLSSAFVTGIAAAAYAEVHYSIPLSIALVTAALSYPLKSFNCASHLLTTAFLCLGAFCYQFDLASVPDHRVRNIYDTARIPSGAPVEVVGTLAGGDEPVHDGAILKIRTETLIHAHEEIPAS